jgi:hypothetical protein
MVIYFGTKYESARVGARVVQVKCDQCGSDYFYELTRIGTGSASAHYGIGASAATRSSQEQSQHDLLIRLASEAELVPCPKCNWINDELVQGYRRGRYRRLGMLAAGVAFFGTCGSLICAWFVHTGPPADRGALPYLLLGGPAVFVSLGLAMILLRCWLRSLIQPNRDYPLAPRVPRGSPPAMILNTVSGKLEPAQPHDDPLGASSGWLDFQFGRHQLPAVCCGCLNSPAAEHTFKQPVAPVLTLEIPRCAACARRSRQHARKVWWGTVTGALLAGGGVLFVLPLDPAIFWVLFSTFSIFSLAIASYVATVAASPVKVGVGDRSRGILRLRFRNPDYRLLLAKRMAEQSEAV